MPDFRVIEAKPFHCGRILRLLRVGQRNAMIAVGIPMHQDLRTCFDSSAFRRAWLIDGQLAGVGGVIGTPISSTGLIWLALSEQATRYPVAMVREAQTQIAELMQVKRRLIATTMLDDPPARRFVEFLGFEPIGREHLSDDVHQGWMLARPDETAWRRAPAASNAPAAIERHV